MECDSADTVTYGPYNGEGYYGVQVITANAEVNTFAQYSSVSQLFDPLEAGSRLVSVKVHTYDSEGDTLKSNPYVGPAGGNIHGRSDLTLMEVVAT